MTGEEAVAYVWSHGWDAHAPGLGRVRELLRRLGDPQKGLRFIHAAGTNGKGSVCACLASVLEAAGYRVGLNTSPIWSVFTSVSGSTGRKSQTEHWERWWTRSGPPPGPCRSTPRSLS